MYRGYRILGSLLLTTALAVPVALVGAPVPQDDQNREHRDTDENRRYYDKEVRKLVGF